jgi:hypothetical protein
MEVEMLIDSLDVLLILLPVTGLFLVLPIVLMRCI